MVAALAGPGFLLCVDGRSLPCLSRDVSSVDVDALLLGVDFCCSTQAASVVRPCCRDACVEAPVFPHLTPAALMPIRPGVCMHVAWGHNLLRR